MAVGWDTEGLPYGARSGLGQAMEAAPGEYIRRSAMGGRRERALCFQAEDLPKRWRVKRLLRTRSWKALQVGQECCEGFWSYSGDNSSFLAVLACYAHHGALEWVSDNHGHERAVDGPGESLLVAAHY